MVQREFYAFLSNNTLSALISPQGTVEWLPCPRFDSDGVFCKALDEARGGFWSILPTTEFTTIQQYAGASNMLETTFHTQSGVAHVRDFLPIGRVALWRVIETEIPLVMICRPTFEFGATAAAYELLPKGALFSHPYGEDALLLHIDGPMIKEEHRDEWQVGPGRVLVTLRYTNEINHAKQMPEETFSQARHVWDATERYWHRSLVPYDGPWAPYFQRSILTLRGLTYRTNGAILAAATTSFPETVGDKRQWDYRFVWIRDGAYAAEALLLAGDAVACRRFLEFTFNVIELVDKPFAAPFYKVDGTLSHGEKELLWLSGYKHSRPVRVGNGATSQTQMDIEGDFLWVVWLYWQKTSDAGFILEFWWAIEALVSWVAQHWQTVDASLWEFRDDDDYYLHSLLMCWVTLKVGENLARNVLHDEKKAMVWHDSAIKIYDKIQGIQLQSKLPYYSQGAKHAQVDAALLTMPLYGFLDVNDPIFLETMKRIETDLVENGFVYRYRADNMGPALYPFTLAGFWLARVYLRQGERAKADAMIDGQLRAVTNLGLFSEHVDPATFEPHGNFPQAFPHAALITTLMERAHGTTLFPK